MRKIILFLVILFGLTGRVEAKGFQQTMDVGIGVFDAATILLDYDATDKDYKISAEVRTANFFDTIYPFIGRYSSEGSNLEAN